MMTRDERRQGTAARKGETTGRERYLTKTSQMIPARMAMMLLEEVMRDMVLGSRDGGS